MRYRLWTILGLLLLLCWLLFHTPRESAHFPPFEDVQVQNHFSESDLINFHHRLSKKRWRLVQHYYKKHLLGKKKRQTSTRIPKILHQICLKKALSKQEEAAKNTWLKHHPDWEYHLWTPKEIATLYLQAEIKHHTDSLAYEILYQFGGVVVGKNLECIKPLDILVENCDFFAGITPMIYNPMLSPQLLGAVAGHPILKHCIETLQSLDQAMEDSWFLTRCFFEKAKKKSSQINVILPSTYFYPEPGQFYPNSFTKQNAF